MMEPLPLDDAVLAELTPLVNGYCDDVLSEADCQRLDGLLHGNPAAQRFLLTYLDIHAWLAWQSMSAHAPAEAPRRRAMGFNSPLLWGAMGAGVVSFVVVLWLVAWLPWRGRDHAETPSLPAVAAAPPLAVITKAAGRWASTAQSVAVGAPIAAGSLDLAQGLVEITFRGGTTILLEAPVNLEIDGPRHITLRRGRLVAHVSEADRGFTISTREATFVDLGTEFGVAAEPESGTQIQVYQGAVVTKLGKTAAATEEQLTAGQARAIAASGAESRKIAFVPEHFVRTFPAWTNRVGPETPYNESRFDTVDVVPAPRNVTIDGDLGDWDLRGMFRSACVEPYSRHYQVQAAMMYDAHRLYLGAHVRDPAPMANTVDPATEPAYYWAGGSVVVRLATSRSFGWPLDAHSVHDPAWAQRRAGWRPQDRSENIVHVGMWYSHASQRARLTLDYGMDFHNQRLDPPGWTGSFRKDADGLGYTLEYAIPWDLLSAAADPPRAGDQWAAVWSVHWGDPGGRTCMGKLVEITNPADRPYFFLRGSTWGKAAFRPARE